MAVFIDHKPLSIVIKEEAYAISYESLQNEACLPGSLLILNAKRELQQLDQYLSGYKQNEAFIATGWSISAQVYDRVIEPFVYRMKAKYFFTSYMEYTDQLAGGVMAGPLIGGGLIALVTASIMGTCAPWYLVGAACLPSLAYLISGIKCFGQGICHLINSKGPDHLLKAKMAFQQGLGCFLIALLLPLACVIAFPIELVRFLTRCVMTVVDLIRNHILEDIAAEVCKADVTLAF